MNYKNSPTMTQGEVGRSRWLIVSPQHLSMHGLQTKEVRYCEEDTIQAQS